MNIYNYEAAFQAADITSRPMRQAIAQWYDLYYRSQPTREEDPCQRIAYTVVGKLVRSVFGEYRLSAESAFGKQVAGALDMVKEQALQSALIGGECFLKPCPDKGGFRMSVMDRRNVLVFGRDGYGNVTDLGSVERSVRDGWFYTLLERRTVDGDGFLTIENKLFRSRDQKALGAPVPLGSHPDYVNLQERWTFPEPVGLGLVRLATPMSNCVDGSKDGVSVYAAAAGLICSIDRNEAQLAAEFRNGQSRLLVSADLLDRGQLTDEVFVGLDEAPENLGIQIFSPQLREQSYLARKQEYLRNVESVIGLKRGMLSDANVEDRTATEISASSGEFNLTVIDFQQVWHKAVGEVMTLCARLGGLYGMAVESTDFVIDWGNGTLYDEDKLWASYLQMVEKGLLKPEIALGWRFNMAADTPAQQAAVREKLMPEQSREKEEIA